jgi:hypothetical protein
MKTMTRPDTTENYRRWLIDSGQTYRDLESADQRWNTQQLKEEFEVHSFLAPFVFVTRKSDKVKGSLEFTHSPRWYFNFKGESK